MNVVKVGEYGLLIFVLMQTTPYSRGVMASATALVVSNSLLEEAVGSIAINLSVS